MEDSFLINVHFEKKQQGKLSLSVRNFPQKNSLFYAKCQLSESKRNKDVGPNTEILMLLKYVHFYLF